MLQQVAELDWHDLEESIPAYLTMVLMPFTYSITNGIGAGFVTYVLIKTVNGKAREIKPLMWVVAAAFVVYFAYDPIEQFLGIGS
jgi:AGZA family xanthine/uracil permease-like MFS transporter